jgi:hypothetical protein
MKKAIILSILLLPLICVSSYGDEISQQPKTVNEKCPHHVYFGPETFLFDLDTHVDKAKVYGLNFFGGPRFRYEYRKPRAFYAGIDLLASWSSNGFHARYKKYHFHRNNNNVGFGNLELRLGYTFASGNKMFSPFFGIGAYAFSNYGSYFHFSEDMFYYTFGMRSLFELSRVFSIGFNWKIFRTSNTQQRFKFLVESHKIRLKDHDNMWGGEIGVPLVWYVGSAKRWEIQLEPYFLKLDFLEVQNIYGTRLLFGYRF